jgi:Bacterial regulatory helix-turn-helix protein, lysR family
MDTDGLTALLLVLEHGSFQAAAETSKQLRSSLRRRVENLEAELGPLLIRQNTGMHSDGAIGRNARACAGAGRDDTDRGGAAYGHRAACAGAVGDAPPMR